MSLFIDLLFPQVCYGCGHSGTYFCPDCQSKIKTAEVKMISPYQGVLPIFHYRGAVKQAVLDLKYHFVSDLAPQLATLISTRLNLDFPNLLHYWQENNYFLIPVPLHSFRQNWRGFNQSELIGRLIASRLKLSFSADFFNRPVYSSPQAKIHQKSTRLHHLGRVFSLNQDQSLPDNLIIFDDVFTTGSTVKSLCSLLPRSKSVWVLTIAG